jgi:hypothetical protein
MRFHYALNGGQEDAPTSLARQIHLNWHHLYAWFRTLHKMIILLHAKASSTLIKAL